MRNRLLAIAASAAAVVLGTSPMAAASPSPKQLISATFADPDVYRVGDTWYAYATGDGPAHVQMATAPALNGPWTRLGTDPLPQYPAWVGSGVAWGPDVSRRADGKFLMYYTASMPTPGDAKSSFRKCIGAALADGPEGPFAPVGAEPLICAAKTAADTWEPYDSIGPSSFVDTDGSRYLLWSHVANRPEFGDQDSSIQMQKVGEDGITLLGSPGTLVHEKGEGVVDGYTTEAPDLVRRPDSYALVYSGGAWDHDDYYSRYATATSIWGPYTKGTKLTSIDYTPLFRGPGSVDVVTVTSPGPEKGVHVVFHADENPAPPPGNSDRGMYIQDVVWTSGRPSTLPGHTFRLRAAHSSKCLDLTDSGTADQVNVRQWDCDGADAQDWRFRNLGGDRYEIKSQVSGKCLDVAHSSTDPGGNVWQYTCNGSAAQAWKMVRVDDSRYRLVSAVSGLCLDVTGASTASGANVEQWTCPTDMLDPSQHPNQLWRLEEHA